MCGKHFIPLMYCDDYEGDFGCDKCRNCWQDGKFIHFYGDQCKYVVYPGEDMPKTKMQII